MAHAEHILHASGMLERIFRLDWVWALLGEAKGDYQTGLRHENDALLVCADKGFRLWQADHFVLRGLLYLLQFQKENPQPPAGSQLVGGLNLLEKAGNDGNLALKIAENTDYIRPKVEALKLLSSYHRTRAQLPEFDREKEKEAAQRYTKEAALIEKGLFLTEQQMADIKVQTKREFEKQTAGWK